MGTLHSVFIYVALFIALYFQVFLLLTYFGWRKRDQDILPGFNPESEMPTVSIIVPCYNEERTVKKTISSLLELTYPQHRLKIVVVDDGSKDSTWKVVQEFADHPQVRLLQKANEGSKFAALNFGLKNVDSDIIGCLDADSRVDTMALMHSIEWFSRTDVYAVVPSMVIDSPKTLMQHMQKVEYESSTYLRQALHRMESMYVAPGPFTLFRKEVFEKVGLYKEAYHTEDLDMGLRMHIAGMRMVHASKSLVYTHGPKTWPALLKQRVRWTYGFIKNMMDYKSYILSGQLGDLSIFILPLGFASILLSVISLPFLVYGLVAPIVAHAQQFAVTGIHFHKFTLDIFSIPSQAYAFIGILSVFMLALTLVIGRKFLLKQKILSLDLLTLIIYPYFSAVWQAKSLYNAALSKKSSWR